MNWINFYGFCQYYLYYTVQAFLDLIVVDDKTCTSAGCRCGGIVVYPEGSLGHGDGSIVDLSICGCQIAKAEGVGPWDGESTLSIPAGTISSTNTCFSSGTSYLEALGREDSSTKSLILTDAYHYVLAIQLLLGGTPGVVRPDGARVGGEPLGAILGCLPLAVTLDLADLNVPLLGGLPGKGGQGDGGVSGASNLNVHVVTSQGSRNRWWFNS